MFNIKLYFSISQIVLIIKLHEVQYENTVKNFKAFKNINRFKIITKNEDLEIYFQKVF